MLKTADIECKLGQIEPGVFQKICNEIMCSQGYTPYDYKGSQKGTYKTKQGTPDSVFKDMNNKYVYAEYTTIETKKLNNKIKADVKKCLEKIKNNKLLKDKVSKIIFIHNNKNPDETITEEVKEMCGNIDFEIYGIDFLADKLQKDCKNISCELLELKDDEIQNVCSLTDDQVTKLATEISKKGINDYKDDSLKEVKIKIEKLYTDTAKIVNNEDAIYYISKSNKEKLIKIYNSLEVFDFYYKNHPEEAELYYHNLLVILSKTDKKSAIDKYNLIFNSIKNHLNTIHLYAILLIDNNNLNEAKKILNKLYYNKKYEQAFETLVRTYFLLGDYDKVIEMLSKINKDKFDRYGFLAAMLLISKNYKKKYSESNIMKLNNSKFNKMPLFYSCTAEMLYDLNKKKNKYKEQFKKGISLLNEKDIIAIDVMCVNSSILNLENEMVKYLSNIKLTPFLKIRLVNFLISKKELNKEELNKIIELRKDMDENEIDNDFVDGIILESKGKELEAILKYKKSYMTKEAIAAAYKYVNISIKNKSKIDQDVINKLRTKNDLNNTMLVVEAYKYLGNYLEAIKESYKTLYLVKNDYSMKDVFRQFWGCTVFSGNKIYREIDHICKNTVVILTSACLKNDKVIVLEDDDFYKENDNILNVEILRSYSEFGSELINHKINDIIEFNNTRFIIKDIKDKYTYFCSYCFKYIKTSKDIDLFKSNFDTSNNGIEQLKIKMLQIDEQVNNMLDTYEENKNIPLSALIGSEKSFEEYAKLINTLMADKNRVLLAGETIDVDLTNGFVIDITSIIIIAFNDLLNIFTDEICNKTYITASLKNKFQYFYESLIRKQDEIESYLGIVNDDNDNKKISLSDIPVNEKIKFWKEVNKYINKFQIINFEIEKDEILNDTTLNFFDKTQFDLIKLAKDKNIPLVCDDLAVRKFSDFYNIKHTNSLKLIEEYCANYKIYLSTIKKYIKSNYIYVFHGEKLVNLFKYLYENFSDDTKKEFEDIINSLFENKISFHYYAPIFAKIILNLKNVQYVNISKSMYENLPITFIINILEDNIIKFCIQYGIDCKTYYL